MERWAGRVAVITGASAGIGAAACLALADAGLRVVGLARRTQLVDELSSQVKGTGSIVSRSCNVADLEQLKAAFTWVDDEMGGTDVLVNNAGVMYQGHITEAGTSILSDSEISSVIDTNLKAVIFCSRHAVASMKRRHFNGHIVNINSVAGHYIPFSDLFNVYPLSKHGVTAFTSTLFQELAMMKSNIKVTSISPGLVDTPMAEAAINVVDFKPLQPKGIADAIIYVLSTPPSVNITELSIQSVQEKRL